MAGSNHARGFSLLELIIILGLMSVLLTIGVVGYSALREQLGLASAARQVATDLALARLRAVSRNREQRLLFAPGTARYRLQEKTGAGFEDIGPAQILPRGIRVDDCTAREDAVSFRSRGGAGSFGTIVLGNTSGDTRSVTVNITGRARIQ